MNNEVISRIYSAARHQISNILPSEWAEKNRFIPSDVSAMKGAYSFYNAPYAKEILDCLHPNNPSRVIGVMKGSQLGLSTGVVENGIGWIISESPGNILFLVGHADVLEESTKKLDLMIDNTPIRARKLIRSSVNRERKTKSGDTSTKKDFIGGGLKIGLANHGMLRNISMRYGFIDDYDRMKSDTKESGSTFGMIESRFKAFWKQMKLYLISSPELLQGSNINEAYLKGDQRKYHVPCPCCGVKITWEWETKNKINENEHAGITYALDENYKLIPKSVGYTCQECGGFFDDKNKSEMINQGEWIPTKDPADIDPDIVSFHISSLYAPTFMKGWLDYVKEYLEANPPNGERIEDKHQIFMNQCLGLPYEPQGKTVSSKQLQNNIRQYEIGSLPEKMSIKDGNGKIVLVTIGADMNGKEDDARIDWEILAHSETGSTYSVDQGSIGTFIPGEGNHVVKADRKKWTYRRGMENSVWPVLEEIANRRFTFDSDNQTCVIAAGCLDTGYFATDYAYPYIENSSFPWFGVKGYTPKDGLMEDLDKRMFWISKERSDLWILNVNMYKDQLATSMGKTWTEFLGANQPGGFMNFPIPSDGKYLFTSYFEHFEGEHKIVDKGKFVWKKIPGKQNHFWDCRVYNMSARDIFVHEFFKALKDVKILNPTFFDFVRMVAK